MFFPHFSRPIIVTVTTLSHAIRLSDRNIESNKKKVNKKKIQNTQIKLSIIMTAENLTQIIYYGKKSKKAQRKSAEGNTY